MTSVGRSVISRTNLDGVKGVSIVDYDSRGILGCQYCVAMSFAGSCHMARKVVGEGK